MSLGNLWRRILGPIAIIVGLGFLLGYAWFLIYSPEETSLSARIFIPIWGTILSVGFLFVGYDWMRRRVSRTLPRNEDKNNEQDG
jgi:hypothetical protein